MPDPIIRPAHIPDAQWSRLETLITLMNRDGTARSEPMREIFARLGDRWSMLLLQILRAGPLRSATLRRLTGQLSAEGRISQRIFTLQLRLLEQNGLIIRTVTPTVPVSVDYSLSPLGHSLLDEVDHVMNWIRANKDAFPPPADPA
ncbi:MAG: helix-turn-helix domain-containing protein [Asticcacaulis sp.]